MADGKFQSADSRDYSKEPPALLDPLWVIRMRKRLAEFAATGDARWFETQILNPSETEVRRG